MTRRRILGTLGQWRPFGAGESAVRYWHATDDYASTRAAHVWWTGYKWAARVFPPPGSKARPRLVGDAFIMQEQATHAADIALLRWHTPRCGRSRCRRFAAWLDPAGVGWCDGHREAGLYALPDLVAIAPRRTP